MKKQRASAFTLVELAIVILIVGIIVAGLLKGSLLVDAFRLSTARSQTENSNVAGVKNLVLWLETTSEASFLTSVEEGVAIDSGATPAYIWNDINPQTAASRRSNASDASGPTYRERCINNLPCLEFNNTDELLATSQNAGSATQLSIFVVFRSDAIPGASTVDTLLAVKGVTHTIGNNSFQLNIDDDVVSYDYFNRGTSAATSLQTAAITANTPYIVDVIDSTEGLLQTMSISGGGIMTRTTATINSGVKNLALGLNIAAFNNGTTTANFFDGRIAEIIIFDRALKVEERNSIESYLAAKWGINIGL
jgi:type II secretory pathway pseudopilin PulG